MNYRVVDECPFCGDENGPWDTGVQPIKPEESEVYGRSENRYSRCRCGGMFQNPMPTDASLAELYRGAYRVLYPEKPYDSKRAIRVFPYFPPVPGDVLDVGCSGGQLMELAKLSGWRVAGVEPHDAARERAKQFGPVYERLDGVRGDFDLISAIHVLEHVADPVFFLQRMAMLLRDDGQMLVVVPKNSYRPPHLLAMEEPQVRMLFGRADMKITMLEAVETKTDAKADIIVRAH